MNNYYSRNKRDQSEELAKIEQKRYEDLMTRERGMRKIIISSVRSSIENNVFRRSNYKGELKSKPNSAALIVEEEVNNNKKNESGEEEGGKNTRPGVRSSSHLPVVKKNARNAKIIRKNKKKELEELQSELNLIEEEEAAIQASLEALDIQTYKKKITATLRTIDEETKELEDSLANTLKTIENTGISPYFFNNVKDLETIAEVQGQNDYIRQISKITIETDKKSVRPLLTKSDHSPKFSQKSNCKVPLHSIYSGRSSVNTSEVSYKPRVYSKDYVRVNPKLNIRNLLYS